MIIIIASWAAILSISFAAWAGDGVDKKLSAVKIAIRIWVSFVCLLSAMIWGLS